MSTLSMNRGSVAADVSPRHLAAPKAEISADSRRRLQIGSWSPCAFNSRMSTLSMNRGTGSLIFKHLGDGSRGGSGLENHVVLAGEFLEQTLLGLSDLDFIFLGVRARHLEPCRAPSGAKNSLTNLRASAGLATEATTATFDAAVEPAQRGIHTAPHTASNHWNRPARLRGVAGCLALAALFAARAYTQLKP